jgi:uncharacterized protein
VTAAGKTALTFMEALWAGDMDACDALLTDDATWAVQLGMPQAAMRESRIWPAREAMRQIVSDLFGRFDPEGFSVETTRVIEQGDSVAVEYQASGRTAGGAEYRNFYVTLLRVRDGKVCDVRPYNDTHHMLGMLGLLR